MNLRPLNQAKGILVKSKASGRKPFRRSPFPHALGRPDILLKRLGLHPRLFHGSYVQFKMRNTTPGRVLIAFLAQYNLVNKVADLRVAHRLPGEMHAR